MLCDRCVLNGKCENFVPGGECAVERSEYEWLGSELVKQYALEGLVDEILVGRVAMYLIRIARAEVYEANVGVSNAPVAWGRDVGDLEKILRGLLKDLALTRSEQKKLEKDDLMVDFDRLLNDFTRKAKIGSRAARKYVPVGLRRKIRMKKGAIEANSLWEALLRDWMAEKSRLEVET